MLLIQNVCVTKTASRNGRTRGGLKPASGAFTRWGKWWGTGAPFIPSCCIVLHRVLHPNRTEIWHTQKQKDAGGSEGGWKGKEGKRFPVWAMGIGEGGVGTPGSTVVEENWWASSVVEVSSSREERWRSWKVLGVSWESEESSLSSEWVSLRGSGVWGVLQRRGLSWGGCSGWEIFEGWRGTTWW